MNTDTHMSDQRSKTTSHLKWFSNIVIRKTSFLSWFLVYQRVLPQACPLQHSRQPSKEIDHSDHPPAIVSSESVDRQVRRDPYSSVTSEELLNKPTKIQKKSK